MQTARLGISAITISGLLTIPSSRLLDWQNPIRAGLRGNVVQLDYQPND
jgi:hypothetical protein